MIVENKLTDIMVVVTVDSCGPVSRISHLSKDEYEQLKALEE